MDVQQMMKSLVTPTSVRLEAMGSCQLRCPSCPTTTKAIRPVIKPGFLKKEDFQKFLDENPEIRHIELSNYGEIFLNPHILDIMEYGHRKGVRLTAANGANLNSVREEVLEGIVKYRLRKLTVSIDGASDETYEKYRVRGNFTRVMQNVRKIIEYKKKYQSPHPDMTWQFIVFGHNEHEIPKAKQMCDVLGMTFSPKISWDPDFSPVKDREFVLRETGLASTRDEYAESEGEIYLGSICNQLWSNPQINWDGLLLGCCRNFWGDFGGNAFSDGLVESLNSEGINYAKEMLLGHQPARNDIPCTTCDIYIDMVREEKWLKRSFKKSCLNH